jgi:kynurenine formamidase
MRTRVKWIAIVTLLMVCAVTVSRRLAQGQGRGPAIIQTPADYLQFREEAKNWGRWGPDDQRGAANLVTASKTLSAMRLVRDGIVVSLAHNMPQELAEDVTAGALFNRTTNNITTSLTTDTYQVSYHGIALSHIDALCHFFFQGQMYNGYSVAENVSLQRGCAKNDIMAYRDGIVTRAVLYDMPRLKGVNWIEPGTPITRADLEAWEKQANVKIAPGDVILLYIGRWKRREAVGPHTGTVAGFFVDTLPFFKERDIAFAGHDFNIDWLPRPGWGAAEGIPGNPIHQALVVTLGVNIFDNLDLEEVVEVARRLNRYEFMFTFAPIPVEGGTGSPLNPLAVF